MLKRLILGLMFLGFISTAFAADVYTGTWKLNVAKSKFSPGPAPKVVNVLITEKGTDLAVSATGTDGADKPIATKYTFPMKGGPITYADGAPPTGAKVILRRPNPNTIEGVSSLDGKETASAVTVLAADGKSFTRTVKSTTPDGKPMNNVEVYERH